MRRTAKLVLLAALMAPSLASADPADARLAQALFDEARHLMEQKRWPLACPKLVESQRLDPGGGTLLNLAVCHASEGKLATALIEFQEALAVATRDGRHDREKLARANIAGLERDVPRLTVLVPPASQVEALDIRLDGSPLSRALWGVSTPVDPGAHTVTATAPGRAPWTAHVTASIAGRSTVEVPPLNTETLPTLPQSPAMGEGRPDALAPGEAISVESPATAKYTTRRNPLFYGVLGVTVVAAGTSIVTGVLAASAKQTVDDGCLPDRNFCRNDDARNAAADARTYAWVSTIALATAFIGVVVLPMVPSQKRVLARTRFSGALVAGAAAIGIGGTF